jgi:hypothetical protein
MTTSTESGAFTQRYRQELEHSDGEWRRERATEASMLHGTEAYNDAMGY